MEIRDQGTRDIFDGLDSKAAGKKLPRDLWPNARRKLDWVRRAQSLNDLKFPPANRLEALKADRKGQHSLRVNQQFRICFRWMEGEAREVEIVDYH